MKIKFEKPGSRENFDYPQMAKESGKLFKISLTLNKLP